MAGHELFAAIEGLQAPVSKHVKAVAICRDLLCVMRRNEHASTFSACVMDANPYEMAKFRVHASRGFIEDDQVTVLQQQG